MIDLAGSIEAAHTRQTAEGCVKIAEDLERYRSIIAMARPNVIIETGTAWGGSARWFADHSLAHVVSIDIDGAARVPPDTVRDKRITFLAGSSIDAGVVSWLRFYVMDKGPTVVVLDSSHDAEHVLTELESYAPFVTPGSYMVVEDTLCRWMTGPIVAQNVGGPLDAVDLWLPVHPEFVNDLALEDAWPVTQHPGGWLRRLA